MGDTLKLEYVDDILIIYTTVNEKISDEELCQNIIKKINKYYKIKLRGFYDINLYKDKNKIVLEFIEDNVEVSEYYNKVDMHIKRINNVFLYEIEDIFDIKINYFYLYNDRYYVDKISDKDREFVKIVYKNTSDILKFGKKIYV